MTTKKKNNTIESEVGRVELEINKRKVFAGQMPPPLSPIAITLIQKALDDQSGIFNWCCLSNFFIKDLKDYHFNAKTLQFCFFGYIVTFWRFFSGISFSWKFFFFFLAKPRWMFSPTKCTIFKIATAAAFNLNFLHYIICSSIIYFKSQFIIFLITKIFAKKLSVDCW